MPDNIQYESDTLDVSRLRRNHTPLPTEKPIVEEKSGLLETTGAFLRTENIVGRAITKELGRDPNRSRDTGFDFRKKVTEDEITDADEIGFLSDAVNEADYEALRDDYASINSDRETIENAGIITGLGATILSAPLDPLNYIPLAGLGGGVARSAVRVGASAFPIASVREAVLQEQQPQRTATEAVVNVAGETLLAGILGGGIALVGGKIRGRVAEKKKQELGNTLPDDIASGKTDDSIQQAGIETLDTPKRQGSDLSRETYYIDEDPIRPDDINARLEQVRSTGKAVVDSKGNELPQYEDPTIRTRNLRAEGKSVLTQRGRVRIDDDFLVLSRNNGNDRLEALVDKYKVASENPKWNYAQRARQAVHKYIFDGNPSGDEITRRINRFEEWEASYKSGQYFKAIDKAEGSENAVELAKAYDQQADAIYTRIEDDIDTRQVVEPVNAESGQAEVAIETNIASDIKGFVDENYVGEGKLKSADVKYDEKTRTIIVKAEC